jgi:hypothetical protein
VAEVVGEEVRRSDVEFLKQQSKEPLLFQDPRLLTLDVRADKAESCVGVGAKCGDRGDAYDYDEGEHHGVLNGRWAIFLLQE